MRGVLGSCWIEQTLLDPPTPLSAHTFDCLPKGKKQREALQELPCSTEHCHYKEHWFNLEGSTKSRGVQWWWKKPPTKPSLAVQLWTRFQGEIIEKPFWEVLSCPLGNYVVGTKEEWDSHNVIRKVKKSANTSDDSYRLKRQFGKAHSVWHHCEISNEYIFILGCFKGSKERLGGRINSYVPMLYCDHLGCRNWWSCASTQTYCLIGATFLPQSL